MKNYNPHNLKEKKKKKMMTTNKNTHFLSMIEVNKKRSNDQQFVLVSGSDIDVFNS